MLQYCSKLVKVLDPGETASYSSESKLFAYGTIVVLGRLRVKHSWGNQRPRVESRSLKIKCDTTISLSSFA